MRKIITILALIMSCFVITSCDENELEIELASNYNSIYEGVYSFTEYDNYGNAFYKAQLTVTKLTDEEFLKSGPNGVVEDDSWAKNIEKFKFELKLIYSDGKEEQIDLGIIKNETEFESVYYCLGGRYVTDKNFYIAHKFNIVYELNVFPEMLAIVSDSEEFSKYEGIYIHDYTANVEDNNVIS